MQFRIFIFIQNEDCFSPELGTGLTNTIHMNNFNFLLTF
jgi:hypothetical protein